ncbi:MAG TPA: nucleotide pyrophosphohydrolase [Acidobacteriota bacterium]|nr:nucleotide pyrophosphohydrolase [Acidobacteriota bacterium]HQG92973.1 nucleotide pyrophosphohydrolase [Acidobacteriota bacterium]HQK86522.1 nucleotide pyrophosphohydrolase [Acidobacteriota bacterium]
MAKVTIQDLQEKVRKFCVDRDWDQYHGPKDLAIGIATEAGELLAHFRFLSPEQSDGRLLDVVRKGEIEDELADVLFFVLRFAQRFNIDLAVALEQKLEKNAARYPVEKARGCNSKYTEF